MRFTIRLLKNTKGGPTIPKPPKPHLYVQKFNNAWHIGRELNVPDKGFKDACLEKGLHVYKPEEIFSAHLPDRREIFDKDEILSRFAVRKKFNSEEEHPYYNERPAYMFSSSTRLIENLELDQAKVTMTIMLSMC